MPIRSAKLESATSRWPVYLVARGGILSEEVDIRLGDVVVGLPTSRSTLGGVVQCDLGKAVRDGKFERTGILNRPPQILATAASKLQAVHQMEGS
ncbi:hypothetical protein BDV12DRAFT_203256 [Aspergillus spectabilis]